MGNVTRIITSDKAGIIEHLTEHKDTAIQHRDNKKLTRRQRDTYRGQVRGLEYAIRTLEDWDIDGTFRDELDNAEDLGSRQ